MRKIESDALINFVTKNYWVVLVASVEVATRLEVTSVFVGVILATLGGGLAQMRRADAHSLTIGQTIAEWGLSGASGFVAHSVTMQVSGDPWGIWSSCVIAGLAGPEGLNRYIASRQVENNEN